MRRVTALLLTLTALVLLAAACGGDDDTDSSPDTAPAEIAPVPEPQPDPAPQPDTEPAPEAVADPEQVVRSYYDALDARDPEAAAALFADDAVVLDTPYVDGPRHEGPQQIMEFVRLDGGSPYELSNFQVSGTTTTWDHVWTNSSEGTCVGTGHNARVADGQIVEWTYAPEKCSGPE